MKVLGEPTLKRIARELVETVRRNVTVDWAERENVRAHLRRLVKRVLRKYGYQPDKQEKATQTVLEQAEVLPAEWAMALEGPRTTACSGQRLAATELERSLPRILPRSQRVQNQITPVNPVVKHCVRFCAWTQSDCTESAGR